VVREALRQLGNAAAGLFRQRRLALLELFVGILAPFAVFAAIADDVVEHQTFAWDQAILEWFHAHATPARDPVMVWISRLGIWCIVVVSVALFAWLVARGRTAQSLFLAVAMLGEWLLNRVTKQLFGRVRPALWVSPAPEQSFSFPSGHTMGSMALATVVAVLAWRTRWRWPAVVAGAVFVLAVSASRLYLGVHYPSDVVAAWMASLAWVVGTKMLVLGRRVSPVPAGDSAG
jgi:membrane-associated phospholipid phosphatase